MEIKNPRRILVLGPPDSGALSLVKALTGSAPTPRPVEPSSAPSPDTTPASATLSTTTAGLTHTLTLKNAYYAASVPIWLDELAAAQPAAIEAWANDFAAPAAAEVVSAVGAWLLVFRLPVRRTLVEGMLRAVERVLRQHVVATEEVVQLAVGMPSAVVSGGVEGEAGMSGEELEELCVEVGGSEYVDGGAKGRNEFGEVVGLARVREALEANEWDGAGVGEGEGEDEGSGEEFGEFGGDGEDMGFGEDVGFAFERAQMEREFAELKMAVQGKDEDGSGLVGYEDEGPQVEELERMMLKVRAVRDNNADLPRSERERIAAQTVRDVMKTL